jgi:hypothetical protein
MSENPTTALLFLGLYMLYKYHTASKTRKRMISLGDSVMRFVVCSGID